MDRFSKTAILHLISGVVLFALSGPIIAQSAPTADSDKPENTNETMSPSVYIESVKAKSKAKAATRSTNVNNAAKQPRVNISHQIYLKQCMPSGIDVEKITTTVTVHINQDGSVKKIDNVSQTGHTNYNEAQMGPIKSCVLQSIRNAAPFRGLEEDNYESWKSIRIRFRANG